MSLLSESVVKLQSLIELGLLKLDVFRQGLDGEFQISLIWYHVIKGWLRVS